MKTFITFSVAIMMSLTSCAGDKVITFSLLPKTAQTFITQNFKKSAIVYCKMDKDAFSTDYEVMMNDGTEIDFDGKGNWEKIENKIKGVSTKFIPKQILHTLSKKYPKQKIVEYDRSDGKIEVELQNDIELIFNKNYKLLKTKI